MADGQGPVLAPSVSLLHKGVNRYGFALFDTARKQITGAEVALYTARADGSGVRGPYVARSESLAVKPQFQSADGGQGPQRRQVRLRRRRALQAQRQAGRRGDRQARRAPAGDQRLQRQRRAARRGGPPGAGDKAISVHTQTLDRRRRRRRPARHAPPARQGPPADRPRRRARQAARRPHLRHARSCARAASAARSSTSSSRSGRARPRASPSSTRRSTRTTTVNKGVRPQVAAWRLPQRALDLRHRPQRQDQHAASRAPSRSASCSARWPRPARRCALARRRPRR